MPLLGEAAHHLGIVPVAWLAILHGGGVHRGAAWWWIGSAYGVSWLADWAAHWVHPLLVSAIYPVTQAALLGAVFLSRQDARRFLLVLVLAGLASILTGQLPDLFLHTVAWLGVVGILWPLPRGGLRTSLLVMFGAGWCAWIGYVLVPGWWTWGALQGMRLLAIAVFCRAAWKPVVLRLV